MYFKIFRGKKNSAKIEINQFQIVEIAFFRAD